MECGCQLDMTDWTTLPLEILGVIAQRLTHIEDFVSFSALCKRCQSVTEMLKEKASLPPRYSRLIVARNKDTLELLNLQTMSTNGVELSEAYGKKFLGAYYGSLFTIGNDLQINLLHPFSRKRIWLPSMLALADQDYYGKEISVRKIVMSGNPTGPLDDCVIVVIYGKEAKLAFARLGNTAWTNIQVHYYDVIYYKGKFYAVDYHGAIVVCDIDGNNSPKATVVAPPPSTTRDKDKKYLVESSGDLLLVSRIQKFFFNVDGVSYHTIGFSILMLDESHKGVDNCAYKLTEVTTL